MICKITRLFSLLILLVAGTQSQAQVNGNKNLQSQTYTFDQLSELTIAIPAEVMIDCSAQQAKIRITVDENILPHLVLAESGNRITIQADTWIEASELKIWVSTPALKKLTTGGYGNYRINNLRGSSFILENPVGVVSLSGQVDEFTLKVDNGEIDAREFQAQRVNATVEGFGIARVHAINYLHAGIWDSGTITFEKKPGRIERDLSERAKLMPVTEYQQQQLEVRNNRIIAMRLRNNSSGTISALVRGPAGHRFSYGFALNAWQNRAEEWPIGTQVFLLPKTGGKKLLVTISDADDGQVVDLF